MNAGPPDATDSGQSWASSLGVRRSMRSNRRTDTSIEKRLRSFLHARGLRYRKDYPIRLTNGRPVRADVAFPGARVVVFVDGCFWHRCPIHGTSPKANADYWGPKLDANVKRDRQVDRQLRNQGWTVVRVWEHEDASKAAFRVSRLLHRGISEPAAPSSRRS
jgi:DNA mismatch endonuclease (patch repair protein)